MSYHVKLKILTRARTELLRRWDMLTNYRLSGAQELTVTPRMQGQFFAEILANTLNLFYKGLVEF